MKSLSADFISEAISLIFNAVILSSKWASQIRKKGLEEIARMAYGQNINIDRRRGIS